MGGYPPGAASDPRAPYNQPDTTHECEFRLLEDAPLFEDGKALFRKECQHETVLNSEPGYEGDRVVTESISCKAFRSYHFEPVKVVMPSGNTILEDEIRHPSGDPQVRVTQALHYVETKPNDREVLDCDPDEERGHVLVESNGYKVRYEANHDNQ